MKLIRIIDEQALVNRTNYPTLKLADAKYEITLGDRDYLPQRKTRTEEDILAEKDIQNRCFKSYNLKEFQDKILCKENIWIIYKYDKSTWDNLVKNEKVRYEDLVCGFLLYYDREVRSGMVDHEIYFYWGKWGNYDYNVVIFIYPPPIVLPKYQYSKATDRYGEVYFGHTEEVDPPSAKASDPPKPPPPPPPSY